MTAGAPKSPINVGSTFFYAVYLLPKDLRFEHGGVNLASCPGRHLNSLRPCAPSKLVGGIRFPQGSCRRLERRCLLSVQASCSALVGGCKGMVHARCCHWLTTSAAEMSNGLDLCWTGSGLQRIL